jgi:redox-sensitive bicupin YhaK (pirin superfamily)
LRRELEYALVVFAGALSVGPDHVQPGQLAYLGAGRDECGLSATGPTRALLFGGRPFPEPIVMWWNFVARTREEISAARRDWAAHSERFGVVASTLPRMEVGPPPWSTGA